MAREVCQQIIVSLFDDAGIIRDVKEADILRLEKLVRRRSDVLRLKDPSLTENAANTAAIGQITNEYAAQIAGKKLAALKNEAKRLQAVGKITANFGKQYGLGLRSLLTGTQRGVRGARDSVAARQDALRAEILGGFHAAMRRLGDDVFRLFLSDAMEDDIARALWQLSQDAPDTAALGRLPKQAVQMAEVIHRYQELTRTLANKEGAMIGKYAGYMFRQTHDTIKIMGDEAGWKARAMETFDIPRMMAEMDYDSVDDMLAALYQALRSGLHLKPEGMTPPTGGGRGTGLGNLGNKLSKPRVIHFKGADAFMAYNRQFGTGNLRESLAVGLERSARNIGLLQVLGTNPGANVDAIAEQLRNAFAKTKPSNKESQRFKRDVDLAKARLAELDGSLDIPASDTLATASAITRGLQNMASLGGVLISSFTDTATFAHSARHNGIGLLQSTQSMLSGLFKGRSRADVVELAADLGVIIEAINGRVAARFSADDGTFGLVNRMQDWFFRINGLTWWTDGLRVGAAQMLSHNLARQSKLAWGALDGRLRRTLELYGMDEAMWNVARKAVAKADDGRDYLTPSMVQDEAVRNALRAYFTDQNGYLVLTPDAETRFLAKAGTQRGTWPGEAARFAMQFKSFTIGFTQKMVGRELITYIDPDVRGLGVAGKALRNGSAMMGLANLLVATTVMGYVAMSLKDIIKGKKPRDPTDLKTMIAAMQQGGGFGIMGDFLFAQQNRAGGGFISTLAGPTAGDIEQIANILIQARDAGLDPEKEAKLGDDIYRLFQSNVPGNNLFWTKPILDYLFLWNVQESLNPGAMERMEKRAQEQGQEFYISPTQRVREQQMQ